MPTYYAHGLLFGTLRTEIGDKTAILCEKSGYRADFNFQMKPMFGGDYHIVSGSITNTRTGKKVYTFTGKWNEDFKLKDMRTKVRLRGACCSGASMEGLTRFHVSDTPTRKRRRGLTRVPWWSHPSCAFRKTSRGLGKAVGCGRVSRTSFANGRA